MGNECCTLKEIPEGPRQKNNKGDSTILGEAKAPLLVERLEEGYNSLDESTHSEASFEFNKSNESFRFGSVT
jgi:hypothetical protein